MAHQMAAAQNHLFWNAAKEEEYRKWKMDGPHSRTVIATSRCLSVRRRGKAYSEGYPPTGCAMLILEL